MSQAPPALNFAEFFANTTGKPQPYRYQCRLACGDNADVDRPATLTSGAECRSQLISVPTGLGKTAAVILAWLWNRVHLKDPAWSRRLVYCLPMRTLVEQTEAEVRQWLGELGLLWDGTPADHPGKVGVHILMGGEERQNTTEWDLYPEENAILIGTQDMLLSRALNRGYGMSRYRWPMHFGLLNNDCLWVLDETQLMGVGVETSAQLDGFRHVAQWLRHRPCPTWWMSATLEDTRLGTVDHPTPAGGWPRLCLEQKDIAAVQYRLGATKRLQRAAVSFSKKVDAKQYAKELAALVLKRHVKDQLTLVIVNRVARAQELYHALQKEGRKENLALVHSRFRSPDRAHHQDLLLKGEGDRIVVATQAVEAGVDVSARVLITELAPWSSLVQRFGRCNRGGECDKDGGPGADIHWINLEFEKDDDVAPYTLAELSDARAELEKLEGQSANPNTLSLIHVTPPPVIRPVIRRKDLVDLFDTTPDIAGHDLDISRYIREGEDTDVQVYWRDLSGSEYEPAAQEKAPTREELCRVAVHQFQSFLDKLKKTDDNRQAFVWDGLNEKWNPETRARPGATYLVDRRAGGYGRDLGWIGIPAVLKKDAEWVISLLAGGTSELDAVPRDPLTFLGKAILLSEHTNRVSKHLSMILDLVRIDDDLTKSLLTAAQWHDVGKAMADFQDMLRSVASGSNIPEGLLGKSGTKGGAMPPYRKYFRHELASALAWLQHQEHAHHCDLIAYVIAAHHGKVRLSIRSMPDEEPPKEKPEGTLMARGIVDKDELPPVPLEGVSLTEKTILHLDLMRLGVDAEGRPSWLSRMIALRDQQGPFSLAYLETLLRSADMRASAEEAKPSS